MLAEQAQDDAERSAIDAERTRIEAEFRQAMQSIPGLRAEVKGTTSLTDIDVRNRDTIESAVAYNMSLIDSLAATFSKYEKASDFYSRISTRGMMFHPQNGRLVTPQEYAQAVEDIEQREEDLAREEAERPFWDLVWHRVDPESLKTDWPEAVKDFRARGLGQLFRPASKGGIAIDEIADELERRNLMPPGGGADALIEKLKEMSPPRRRRSRRLRYGQELAQEEKNSFGVPLSRVTRIEGNVTAKDVEIALEELAGQDLPNLIEGITAQVNSKQRGKLNSEKARNKSLDNGFTHAEHKGIAKNIAQAWKWAAEAQRGPDRKNNSPDLIMHKYVAALNVNGQDAFVWITARESPDGLRLYSVELMNEEKLRETVNAGDNDIATYVRNRSFEEILSRLNRPVNGQETTRH
ncbi:hypothetical protein [uncultured Mailhella sp.]|uniref:LPD3 domain-containing protein n=1 Tax=uncultured Mailhella sp. TaxID=1981031 RepID=UPI002601BA18|nr:hypothetical protein [uncultured Mailhella sp.]